MLPSNRRNLLEEGGCLGITVALFAFQQRRQDRGIVVNDAVGNQTATFIPDLLFVFGFEAQLAKVGM